MKIRSSLYWRCQLSGWLLYVLIMIFYTAALGFEVTDAFYYRIGITGCFGLLFTHILKLLLVNLELRPPVQPQKIWVLVLIVSNMVALFPLADAAVVGWVGLADQGPGGFSLGRRFVYNIVRNGPLVPIWVMFYYLWHFSKLYKQPPVDSAAKH